MKKLFVTLLFSLLFICTYGQAKVGYSKEALIKELTADGLEVIESETESGMEILSVQYDTILLVIHLFDENFSFSSLLIPKGNKVINYYVRRYNEDYVTIAHNKWMAYLEHYICIIDLIYDKDLGYIFVWTVKE